METVLNIDDQPEVNELVDFINSLDSQNLREFNALVQGVKFGMLLGNADQPKESA